MSTSCDSNETVEYVTMSCDDRENSTVRIHYVMTTYSVISLLSDFSCI